MCYHQNLAVVARWPGIVQPAQETGAGVGQASIGFRLGRYNISYQFLYVALPWISSLGFVACTSMCGQNIVVYPRNLLAGGNQEPFASTLLGFQVPKGVLSITLCNITSCKIPLILDLDDTLLLAYSCSQLKQRLLDAQERRWVISKLSFLQSSPWRFQTQPFLEITASLIAILSCLVSWGLCGAMIVDINSIA